MPTIRSARCLWARWRCSSASVWGRDCPGGSSGRRCGACRFSPLAAELLASPAYSREDWFLPVRLAFALDGLAAMALALWLGYALGTLFRRGEDAAAEGEGR